MIQNILATIVSQKIGNKNLFPLTVECVHDVFSKTLQHKDVDLEEKFPNFSRYCNVICSKYLYDYLTTPLISQNNLTIHVDHLKSLLNIVKDYEKFYEYMLNILIRDKLLTVENDILSFSNFAYPSVSPSKLKQMYPVFQGTLSLLDHCITHYAEALSGKIPAISVLYPEGNTAFLDKKFSEDTAIYSELPILKDGAIKVVSHVSRNTPLNILEIGGGRGIFTLELFNDINTSRTNSINYHFTDIGRRFVIDMQRHVNNNNLNYVKCSQFDITKNPIEQGIDLNSYDIIIGLDVVHATPDIEKTLCNLKLVMKNHGILCLLETTHAQRWQNLIMGLITGWWLFNDEWRTSSPLLPPGCWKKVMEKSGFSQTNVTTLQNKNSDAALIIATP